MGISSTISLAMYQITREIRDTARPYGWFLNPNSTPSAAIVSMKIEIYRQKKGGLENIKIL
jgi:hypothetical protein